MLVARFRHLPSLDAAARANVGIIRTTRKSLFLVELLKLTFANEAAGAGAQMSNSLHQHRDSAREAGMVGMAARTTLHQGSLGTAVAAACRGARALADPWACRIRRGRRAVPNLRQLRDLARRLQGRGARTRAFPPAVIERGLAGVVYDPAIIRRDQGQGVFQQTFLTFFRPHGLGRPDEPRHQALGHPRRNAVPRRGHLWRSRAGVLVAFWGAGDRFRLGHGQVQGVHLGGDARL